MELIEVKQREDEPLREFVKRYQRVILDLEVFNHPQALKGLKKWVRTRKP